MELKMLVLVIPIMCHSNKSFLFAMILQENFEFKRRVENPLGDDLRRKQGVPLKLNEKGFKIDEMRGPGPEEDLRGDFEVLRTFVEVEEPQRVRNLQILVEDLSFFGLDYFFVGNVLVRMRKSDGDFRVEYLLLVEKLYALLCLFVRGEFNHRIALVLHEQYLHHVSEITYQVVDTLGVSEALEVRDQQDLSLLLPFTAQNSRGLFWRIQHS